MRRFTAKAIASVPGFMRSHLRLVTLAVAGVVLAVAVIAIVPSVAIEPSEEPGSPETRPGTEAERNAETVIAKFAEGETQTNSLFAEPTPASKLLSMALVPAPALTPQSDEEPNLAGLNEIPKELIWNRPEKKGDRRGARVSFAAGSRTQDQLPWDAVEPVPFSALSTAEAADQAQGTKTTKVAEARPPIRLSGTEVGNWLKAKVTEIKGADRSRALYHFELWLEPPSAIKRRLVGVSYAFSSPAIRPRSQASSDRGSGFRISAGGLACADEIIVTLRFDDGRVETASVDGCELLS